MTLFIIMLQIFIPYATTQAVLAVAVLFLQLDERLTVARGLHIQPALLPHADDVIILSLQLLQEVESTVAEILTLTMTTDSKQDGDGRIDNEQIGR